MWDVYVVDAVGIYRGNSQPLNIIEAEHLHKLLEAGGLVAFLFRAGTALPEGFLGLCG